MAISKTDAAVLVGLLAFSALVWNSVRGPAPRDTQADFAQAPAHAEARQVLVPDPVASVPVAREVVYRVTGTCPSISLTYRNDTGGTSQESNMAVPRVAVFNGFERGDHLYLSAQNQGDYGTVKAEILVDGVVVKTSESQGAYVIATVSGILE